MSKQRLRLRGLFQKYFLVLFLAVVIPLATNGVSEAWFGYRDQRATLDQLAGGRGAVGRRQDPGLSRRHHQSARLAGPASLDRRTGRAAADRCPAPAAAGAGHRQPHASRRQRTRASLCLAHRPEPNREPHRPLGRRGRGGSPLEPALVRRGQLLPRLRALHDGCDIRQSALGRRGCRRGEPEADLGRDLGHQGRRDGRRLRAGRAGPARRPSGHQPRAAGRGRGDARSLPGRSGRRSQRAGADVATGWDAEGIAVAAAAAPVAGPDWTVVVEQPLSEAFGPIYAALWRTGGLLLAGAAFAGLLAYRPRHAG